MDIGKSLKLVNEIEASPLFRFRDALTDLKQELNSISEGISQRDQAIKEKAALQKENEELKAEQKTLQASVAKTAKGVKDRQDALQVDLDKRSEDFEKQIAALKQETEARTKDLVSQSQKEINAKAEELEKLTDRISHDKVVLQQMGNEKTVLMREIDQLKAGLDHLRQQHFGG